MNKIIVLALFCLAKMAFAFGAEHHLLLCDNKVSAVMKAFNVRPDDGSRKDVIYFDDMGLRLYKKGIVARLRFENDNKVKVDLKLRPVDPELIPENWRKHPDLKCEFDLTYHKRVGSCRLRRKISKGKALSIFKSKRYQNLFSKDQIDFLQDIKGERITWSRMVAFGPTQVQAWNSKRFPFSIEIIALQNKGLLAEISTRTSNPDSGFEKGLIRLAQTKNLKICKAQNSKTVRILASLQRWRQR